MANIGYARVSTIDQNLNLQLDELRKANCLKIFQDVASGVKSKREGLDNLLEYIRPGDVLVVWKLDRLGRSFRHLIDVVNNLEEQGIGFYSISENINTTSNQGKLIFHIFSSLAEFERSLIKERTIAGLKAARARGRLGGRPKKMDKEKIIMAKALFEDKSITVKDICRRFGIGKTTFYKYLKEE